MGFLLIANAVISALQGAVNIVRAFRKEVYDIPVASGHGHGFWDFYSYSETSKFSVRMTHANAYLALIVDDFTKSLSGSMKRYRDTILSDLSEIVEFESYVYEEAQGSINQISYSGESGKLCFFVYTFTPGISAHKNVEILKSEFMSCEIEMRLAQDWILVNHIKSTFAKTTNSLEIQYLPTSIDSAKVVEAVAIAFAPVVLGLVKVPATFLTLLKASIKQKTEDPYSGISEETYSQSEKLFDDMIKRQEEKDALFKKGVNEIGEAAASLTK